MTTRVLFICPHAAGKSLLAATYFRAAAQRWGLDVEIDLAGPDPDPVNMPNVTAALSAQGHTVDWAPRLLSEEDTNAADVIVSVGCELGAIPTTDPVTEWSVPQLSDDFAGSVRSIHSLAEAMAAAWGESE